MPRECLAAGHARVGYLAERLPCGNVAQMDFDGGQGDGLESIQNGDGRVGIGGWINDDAIELAKSLLYPIDENAFVVGLADIDG